MPDRDDKIFSDEKVRFSKFTVVVLAHLNRSKNDKSLIAIKLHFGSLVGISGVLHSKLVKSKLLLDPVQHIFSRFLQTDPDELVRLFKNFMHYIELNVCNAAAF